ncbi:MAG: type IV toxin-antitoxin system AbiEi family antitoxin [Acidobacteria bacterium]|uniref:Type IV toxin-antitoxin system AbiEi family antitoxin n=1 Tax=Candidatus Polarisedimenticola svalbardensis TaxID=2886004 RepID=A0A8J7C292_9BACT|nr:type IV toxin-antitoxin system AbiEi family antitoxin [Candidatus Polarisedimenticola svalbardensis]
MRSVAEFIQDLQARGRYHFTTDEAVEALAGNTTAVRAAIRRLTGKSMVATPHRGFHVIVPPEYRELGCLPADQFIPDLMDHLGEPYYICLLSAAAYHGSAHQKPQLFQVMVPQGRRPIDCGRVRVRFLARQDMSATPVIRRNTARGVLRIASAEATALELVGYMKASGGLDHVATVLRDLVEVMERSALAIEAHRAPAASVQRLGYLLMQVHADSLAFALDPILKERKQHTVPLSPSLPITGCARDKRWNVAVNTRVDSEQ